LYSDTLIIPLRYRS